MNFEAQQFEELLSDSSVSTLDISVMSGPPDECFVCSTGVGMDHLCINLAEFQAMAIKNPEEKFEFFDQPINEQEQNDQIVEYADEGPLENEPADLSIIDDLEESVGYVTQLLETPPRIQSRPRRSSTPRRRRSLTFEEFLENLVDDSRSFEDMELMINNDDGINNNEDAVAAINEPMANIDISHDSAMEI